MITGAVAGDRPTANVSGYTAFFPYVNRGCTVEAINFDLDADNAEGNGSVASMTDTLGAASDLARSNNDNVASTTVTVEPTGVTNLVSNNYGMFRLQTQLDEWATAQNHVDWRVADFEGSTAGAPATFPRRPTVADAHLPPERLLGLRDVGLHARRAAGAGPGRERRAAERREPAAAGRRRDPLRDHGDRGEPRPDGDHQRADHGAAHRPRASTFVTGNAGRRRSTGVAAACTDGSTGTYRRCTFATLGAGQYASLGLRGGLPAHGHRRAEPDRGTRRRHPAAQHDGLGAVHAGLAVGDLAAHRDAGTAVPAGGERGAGRRT